MTDAPRAIWVLSLDDYEGGPFSPAFTSREACEQHLADLVRLPECQSSRFEIEEWPLLEKAPARVPYWRRGAQVHWDGFVCPGRTSGSACWDFEGPESWRGPVVESGFGMDVSVAVKDESALDGAFGAALGEAHARALAAKRLAVQWCGPDCAHPAVRRW